MSFNPVQQVREMAEGYGGVSSVQRGVLQVTFSEEATGDVGLRSFFSELCSSGVSKGDPAVLTPSFFADELSSNRQDLSENVDVRRIGDEVTFDIRLMGLA